MVKLVFKFKTFFLVRYLPIVVRTVVAKKSDWPKLQLGSDIVTFFEADTPRLAALTIILMKLSNSSSITKKNKTQYQMINN